MSSKKTKTNNIMDSTINLISDKLHFGAYKTEDGGNRMDNRKRLRLGLSGCGSFSIVVASAVKRSNKAELITCFDVLPRAERNVRSGLDAIRRKASNP